VRVITATNAPLAAHVDQGRFRRDLYYRLNVFPLHVPPLRERTEDIPLLARHFLARLREAHDDVAGELSPDALVHLLAQRWPGNVRELRHTIERAALVAASGPIGVAHLLVFEPEPGGTGSPSTGGPRDDADAAVLDLPGLTSTLIRTAMQAAGGNVSAAARLLGISRPTLRYRLKKERSTE
jgi:DNA-binding NtrC family response regulator